MMEQMLSEDLFQAIASSDAVRVREIVLDKGYDVRTPLENISSRNYDCILPLHAACIYTSNLQIFEILLNAPGGMQALKIYV